MLLVLLFITEAYNQDTLAISNRLPANGYIASGLLLTTGIIVNSDKAKNGFRDIVRKNFEVQKTSIDDYLQHTPMAMMYLSGLALNTKKEEIWRQTRHLLTAQAGTLLTVYILKSAINNQRPNGGSRSFPSGHTAYAFASANVMFHSFKDEHKVLAYSGYLPAIVTGVYRMLKDKHWISDVLTGAGIGILFSHLTYHLDIWKSRSSMTAKTSSNVQFNMSIGPGGVGLAVRF